MIGVCLITCGRLDLTFRTVQSFNHFNAQRQQRDMVLLHADGGGTDRDGALLIAKRFGFRTVDAPTERVPLMASYRRLIEEAALKGAEFILWLENDWESVASSPPLTFYQLARDEYKVEAFRLFGKRKMQADGPRAMAGACLIGTTTKIAWAPSRLPGWEIAPCHWGAGGCVARLDVLEAQIHRRRLKDVITSRLDVLSLRPRTNFMWHIGTETTEGMET